MENITIRPATEQDMPALLRLYLEFHEFHVSYLPAYLSSLRNLTETERERMQSNIRKVVNRNDSAILVAVTDSEMIGLAEVHLKRPDAESMGAMTIPYTHLQSLMVTEGCRRQGIGSQLLIAAETWARQHGSAELRLDTWEFAQGPLSFYDRHGYSTLKRTLTKLL